MRNVRADLHNHIGSKEKIEKYGVRGILNQATKTLGSGGVLGVVNFLGQFETPSHFHYDNFYRMCDGSHDEIDLENAVYFPKNDLLVVRGEEVVVFENGYESHLLVLGTKYDTHMTPLGTLEDVVKECRNKNAVIGLDHPFYWAGVLLQTKNNPSRERKILDLVDFLEVHNGEAVLPKFGARCNKKTQRFYREHKDEFPNLGAIVSSDGHYLSEVGSSYTIFSMPEDYSCFTCSDDVIRHLKAAIIESKNPTENGKMITPRPKGRGILSISHNGG